MFGDVLEVPGKCLEEPRNFRGEAWKLLLEGVR